MAFGAALSLSRPSSMALAKTSPDVNHMDRHRTNTALPPARLSAWLTRGILNLASVALSRRRLPL